MSPPGVTMVVMVAGQNDVFVITQIMHMIMRAAKIEPEALRQKGNDTPSPADEG